MSTEQLTSTAEERRALTHLVDVSHGAMQALAVELALWCVSLRKNEHPPTRYQEERYNQLVDAFDAAELEYLAAYRLFEKALHPIGGNMLPEPEPTSSDPA